MHPQWMRRHDQRHVQRHEAGRDADNDAGPGEGPAAREADAGQTRQQLEGAGTRQRDEHDQEVEGTDGQDVADGEEQHDA